MVAAIEKQIMKLANEKIIKLSNHVLNMLSLPKNKEIASDFIKRFKKVDLFKIPRHSTAGCTHGVSSEELTTAEKRTMIKRLLRLNSRAWSMRDAFEFDVDDDELFNTIVDISGFATKLTFVKTQEDIDKLKN